MRLRISACHPHCKECPDTVVPDYDCVNPASPRCPLFGSSLAECGWAAVVALFACIVDHWSLPHCHCLAEVAHWDLCSHSFLTPRLFSRSLTPLARCNQAATQFKTSLAKLMEILMSKDPSYVRCIKPNDAKQAGLWTSFCILVFCSECLLDKNCSHYSDAMRRWYHFTTGCYMIITWIYCIVYLVVQGTFINMVLLFLTFFHHQQKYKE